jgi:phosphoribosylanthranilate isomerase
MFAHDIGMMNASTQPLPTPRLETIGFCGVDDTILDPTDLVSISLQYPLVEWGFLFRPDKGKESRYATSNWIERFCHIIQEEKKKKQTNSNGGIVTVRLAAHLCGIHVNNLLSSSKSNSAATDIDAFLDKLVTWGFTRVQINATAVNGVDTNYDTKVAAESFLRTSIKYSQLEFIVQCNTETKPLWSALLLLQQQQRLQQQQQQYSSVNNIVFLHDESKGTGTTTTHWPTDSQFISSGISRSVDCKTIGYAGGINPTNIVSVISSASKACSISGGTQFWLDMESGVRSIKTVRRVVPGRRRRYAEVDTFDLDKCMGCINLLCDAGWIDRPLGWKKEEESTVDVPQPMPSLSTEEQTCGCSLS